MPAKIPLPITYNPYKHHLLFLLEEIERWKKQDWQTVHNNIILIGSNLTDFYTGILTIEAVCAEIKTYFAAKKINSITEFRNWLNGKEWRKIPLSDQSEWLIKKGDSSERFIHIHPGKYSKHTIRVRASTLKTVLALKVKSVQLKKDSEDNLQQVNTIRQKLLNLSPIKSLDNSDSGILRLWKVFECYSPGIF